jgi:polar amino acid transport system substrate-binding protein/glutamate/aspartate transport system substrate-binding protein
MRSSQKVIVAALGAAIFFTQIPATAQTTSPTIAQIRSSKTVRIAYRADAPPFSFKNSGGAPTGFIVELCKSVVQQLANEFGIPSLGVSYVEVTSLNRFQTIQAHKADMLCDPSSITLSRRKVIDFSLPTYVDGAGLMIRGDGPRDLGGLSGKKIGVLAGTTTEQALRNTLQLAKVTADVVPTKSYDDGLGMLDGGTVSAFFADRSILESLILKSKAPDKLAIADNYLTVEPYALGLPRGDDDFRLAVDVAISRIYRSGEIAAIFNRSFGANARPSSILQTLYLLSGLPN